MGQQCCLLGTCSLSLQKLRITLCRCVKCRVRRFQARRRILCAVLLCRLSVGDSSPLKDTVVSDQCTQSSPWEGEAPAEPKSVARVQLSLFANNRSPSIPARPHPLKNTGHFKGDDNRVPGLKPRLRQLSLASFLPGRLLPTQSREAAHVDPSLSHSVG